MCFCGRVFDLFQGGILGCYDDMVKVGGVQLAPQMIEEIISCHAEKDASCPYARGPGPAVRIVASIRFVSRATSNPARLIVYAKAMMKDPLAKLERTIHIYW